ncbi:MAG: aminotransferase class I/II-fold pyridoxal phosphate-dependent enzyme [Deltaproteobacteria bacterium]|nr:aminotransferase class I/II-fold pyridoxal phosphate-dependent enzyme [Deltaproteobacteria bacterium]
MTQLCNRYEGVNLAQGFPDFDPLHVIKAAAQRAIADGYNQYAVTWGAPRLRQAIAEKVRRHGALQVDPEAEITVTCGATEAMIATLLAVINPGDEVVVFEPFYENYGPDTIIAGATPRYVPLRDPGFTFDPDELRRAFGSRTKAIIVNTPHNPTGRVFTRGELQAIAALCQEFDALAVTDEIYEHIVYDGRRHVSLATLPGMAERTVTISGLSKTYSVTGWRVAYAIAPPPITAAIRKMHDFLTVGAPAPLQEAAAVALALPQTYYDELRAAYGARRRLMVRLLHEAGFRCFEPEGAYYVMCDIEPFGFKDDVECAPGSSFYHDRELGRHKLRFHFAKTEETLRQAGERLKRVKALLP